MKRKFCFFVCHLLVAWHYVPFHCTQLLCTKWWHEMRKLNEMQIINCRIKRFAPNSSFIHYIGILLLSEIGLSTHSLHITAQISIFLQVGTILIRLVEFWRYRYTLIFPAMASFYLFIFSIYLFFFLMLWTSVALRTMIDDNVNT